MFLKWLSFFTGEKTKNLIPLSSQISACSSGQTLTRHWFSSSTPNNCVIYPFKPSKFIMNRPRSPSFLWSPVHEEMVLFFSSSIFCCPSLGIEYRMQTIRGREDSQKNCRKCKVLLFSIFPPQALHIPMLTFRGREDSGINGNFWSWNIRQTLADYRSPAKCSASKIIQTNLTVLHDILLKGLINTLYISGVRRDETFEVGEKTNMAAPIGECMAPPYCLSL